MTLSQIQTPVGRHPTWLQEILKDKGIQHNEMLTVTSRRSPNSMCVLCKGSRFLCGKTRCPIIVKTNYFLKSVPLMSSEEIAGASPPSVFVGRIGYPMVYAGPLVPPIIEDTSLFDLPEEWFGKTIDQIVAFRSLLIRGKHRVHVQKFPEAGKIINKTRELALAIRPVEVELLLTKKPRGNIFLDDEVQPFGPSAPIRSLELGNAKWDQHIEKAYSDTDLKATPAVQELYIKGVNVSRIQKAFSVGAFGLKKNRRLVPTRWSITAVDSILSKNLMEKVKTYPEINEFRLYESRYLDNIFEILMIPNMWKYESIEAWFPGTVWNPNGKAPVMFGDWEGDEGRTTYASIGGCYYAARLATCELLVKERRQATVVVLREARPDYIMPVGVWQVRENVRNAMRQVPLRFNSLNNALQRIATQLSIPLVEWITKSEIIHDLLFQKRITDYFAFEIPKVRF